MSYNEDIQEIEYEVSAKFGLERRGIFVAWEDVKIFYAI